MKKVIAILGPTASGKTKLSIMLAKHYNIDIISGDSVAIYKELNIGSAKPTKEEMDGVVHHLIDIKELNEEYSVYDFQHDSREIIDKNELSMIAGGTGLYIKAALFNYEFEAKGRENDNKYDNMSNQQLYDYLLSIDPDIDKEKLHPNNRKRVIRAIEVKTSLNKSIHSFNKKDEPLYDYFICYLKMDREILYDRISKRVDKMMEDGLLNEVKAIYDKGYMPHAIGYQEFVPYFNGECDLNTVIDEIKKNTRHLAKRQETWFKNQMKSHFYNVDLNDINNTYNEIVKDIDWWLNK